MRGNLGKAIACFGKLGIKPDLHSFQSKLIMQKTVYLLQAMGVKMGYQYGWYVRGNYSPDLTKDLYENKDAFGRLSESEALSQKESKAIEEFLEEMGGRPDPAVLEIAAAYAYFFKQYSDVKQAIVKTKEAKPFFSELQFVQGINRAKALVYKPTEEELKRLKAEMAPWEAASDETWRKMV